MIPDSPPFSLLVAAATGRSNSACSGPARWGNTYSAPEDSSQESVFNQLTQGMDEEENNGGRPEDLLEAMMSPSAVSADVLNSANSQIATQSTPQSEQKGELPHDNSEQPSHLQASPQKQILQIELTHERSSPPKSLSPTFSMGTPVTRQSWYQSPYLRRPSRRIPNTELKTKPEANTEVNMATSASPELVPANHTAEAGTSDSQPETQGDWTGTESQAPASYPPLQRQGPIWSQSMSQD